MIKCCPTEEMVSDYTTKILTCVKFQKYKTYIMNEEKDIHYE